MITRENFPLVAKQVGLTMSWSSTAPSNVQLDTTYLTFDNSNVTSAGDIQKERTMLSLGTDEPIEWGTALTNAGVTQGAMTVITSIWASPEDALRDIIGILYESDEHKLKLGL
jgi:hypothetical protein